LQAYIAAKTKGLNGNYQNYQTHGAEVHVLILQFPDVVMNDFKMMKKELTKHTGFTFCIIKPSISLKIKCLT
jgi:hypothetical protein